MPSNFPRGFHGFQMRLDAITEAMRGDDKLRLCIAAEFDEQLRRSVAEVRRVDRYALPWRYVYTMATTEEFDHASEAMERILRVRDEGIVAEGRYRGMTVVQRGHVIYVEGGGYCLNIAMRYRDEHAVRRVGRDREKREDSWSISINDHAEKLKGQMPTKPTRVSAHSDAAADRGLRDIVKRHLGVEMKLVEEERKAG